jgi:hypothetical protein
MLWDGQVALILLAVALWSWSPRVFERSWGRSTVLSFALSTKVFTLFALGQSRFSLKAVQKTAAIGFLFALFSIPAVLVQSPGHGWTLLQHWREAATSGGALLTSEQIRGRLNPSLTRFVLNAFSVKPDWAWADIGVSIFLAMGLGGVWKMLSKRMPPVESWVGWLGLVPVVHPLPWWHLFVFSFPLAQLVLIEPGSSGDFMAPPYL